MSPLSLNESALRKTVLNETHRRMGATMVPFGGWDMPIEYSGIVSEHLAVRAGVGLFDVSHMGEVEIDGSGALALIQKVTCNDASRLLIGQAHYSGLMNERGGLVDDLLVHRIDSDKYFLCVNASRQDEDFAWIAKHNDTGARLRNASADYSQLAVQGPLSLSVLQPLTSANLAAIKYYWFVHGEVCGTKALIARTGYTGEDGFEIYIPNSEAERLWDEILAAGKAHGIVPCGLGARNTLRLESAMMLYGHEIDEATTPLEAGLGWITKLEKGPFLGSDVLARQKSEGVKKKLVGFQLTDRGIARDDAAVWHGDQQAGKVTSGSYAPFLKKSIGLAYVPSELSQAGQKLSIDIRGKMTAAEVVPTPFYKRPKK